MSQRLLHACASLLVAAVLIIPAPGNAAEKEGKDGKEGVEVRKEGVDAMATGTKGVSEGTIVSNEKGKVILKTNDGNLLFMAHWRGGMPKDGGGMDKAMLETLGKFKAGDRVKINWTWEERRRVEQIERIGG